MTFDIFGPANDPAYWAECEQLISRLPAHVKVHYRELIPNVDVAATLAGYDLFLLPTRGENFGHAIFDALEVGLPVLISDQTPWRELERIGRAGAFLSRIPIASRLLLIAWPRSAPPSESHYAGRREHWPNPACKKSDAVARMRAMLNGTLGRSAASLQQR